MTRIPWSSKKRHKIKHLLGHAQNWQCVYCHRVLVCGMCFPGARNGIKATFEHVIQISLGGRHRVDNMALACFGCNSAKANKPRWDPTDACTARRRVENMRRAS